MNPEVQLRQARLRRMVIEADKRARDGRVARLSLLEPDKDSALVPMDALAYEYYEGARLCWYVGAFVAAIVMAQLAFEETLRSHYRRARGVRGRLNDEVEVDRARFVDLIEQARVERLLRAEEAAALNQLRKQLRNPYVHPKDIRATGQEYLESIREGKTDFLIQGIKISTGEVESEAKEAVFLLVTLFPMLSQRLFP